MTKKHYEAIAKIIQLYKAIESHSDKRMCYYIAHDLADYFQTDNKNFNRERFLEACGIIKENNNPFNIVTHIDGKRIK